ncbi:MAG: nodulation protein [Deltaproteobacteria bacterium]|nr:nodulation protein [Deltaproteobacteria bacterium]
MLILGLNRSYHDYSAVLVRSGRVLAALEEERLNRVKHSIGFPLGAIEFCLRQAKVSPKQIGLVAISASEAYLNGEWYGEARGQSVPEALSARETLALQLEKAGTQLPWLLEKVRFVPHQLAHAASAFFCSGFDEALVLALDGYGDEDEGLRAGLISRAHDQALERLRSFRVEESLGTLYGQVTKFVGFREYDEFKLMGLAPYGDPRKYRDAFAACLDLTSDGWFKIRRVQLLQNLFNITAPREPSAALRQVHKDIAAACQELLERVVLHVLAHAAQQTGLTRLAMAGGVALNCTMNYKVLGSGLFEDVFVQPASSDAGGALGAALLVEQQAGRGPRGKRRRLETVYWGTPVPPAAGIERELRRWRRFIEWKRCGTRIAAITAELLARGSVVGWVQSRSEFGPRALGNRSILADPRPASNRDRVNRMIKQRESFRPFAPSVLEEKAREYFELPEGHGSFPFMLFVAPVRPKYRRRLGAVTHVDGTARLQTVRRQDNPRYWEVIRRFGERTGVYVVLNTSFNNSAEPIVDSVEDAVVAYLTTGLDRLVIGDYLITKREVTDELLLDAGLQVTRCAVLQCRLLSTGSTTTATYNFEDPAAARPPLPLCKRTFDLLSCSDGTRPLRALLAATPGKESDPAVLADCRRLWWHRFVRVMPL